MVQDLIFTFSTARVKIADAISLDIVDNLSRSPCVYSASIDLDRHSVIQRLLSEIVTAEQIFPRKTIGFLLDASQLSYNKLTNVCDCDIAVL